MANDTETTDEIDDSNPPFVLTEIDRQVLATRDEDFHLVTWPELREIIETNQLETLKRKPSDLKRYLHWAHKIRKQYGGLVPFVIQERLRWTPQPSSADGRVKFQHNSSIPFADPRDYAILPNDWPYGFEPGITHLLVWSKTPIPTDLEEGGKGDLIEESRRVIEKFVECVFVGQLAEYEKVGMEEARERVTWFKNWGALQSVRGADHVHVLVKDVPEQLLERWVVRRDL
jgi:hypothetical protein